MIVITFLLRRRADLSAAEFHHYWRDHHGPLVASHARVLGIRRYMQLHATDSPLGTAIAASRGCAPHVWDGIALVWFDNEPQLGRACGCRILVRCSDLGFRAGVIGAVRTLRGSGRGAFLLSCSAGNRPVGTARPHGSFQRCRDPRVAPPTRGAETPAVTSTLRTRQPRHPHCARPNARA